MLNIGKRKTIALIFAFLGVFFEYSKADENCGPQDITAQLNEEDSFQFPAYPENHGTYLDCTYTVQSPNGTRIRFWVDSFGIDVYGSYFYIWCYDGDASTNRRFEVLNKRKQEGVMFHSTSDMMTLVLRVPRSYIYSGFQLTISAVVACGDQLEALNEIQELTSPGFPFKHLSNQICTWPIRAPVNHVIEITANQISSERCCDRVQVGDPGQLLSKGDIFMSAGQELRLEFIANNSIERKTFQLTYQAVHVCGKQRQLVVNDYFVQLQAPAFPGEYSSSLNCEYTFIAPEGTRIRFWIDDFGTERFGSYYYLWFYDGLCDSNRQFLILDKPNQLKQLQHSRGNTMLLKLQAYKTYTYTGFSMTYKSVASCSSELVATEEAQDLTSPGYPGLHQSNLVCTWLITVPRGFFIELVVNYLSEDSCCIYLEAEGSRLGNSLVRLNSSHPYYSTWNEVMITFVVNDSLIRDGFELSYTKAPCGRNLDAVAEAQEITSPNYPLQHRTNHRCVWTITAPAYHVINITVLNISDEVCCTSLQVTEPNRRIFTNLTAIGEVYVSPGVSTRVEFNSTNSVEREGFRLEFKTVPICGAQDFEADFDFERTIHPPPFPAQYPSSTMTCWYTIIAPEQSKIRFWVDDFGTERFDSSLYYLWVHDNTAVANERFLTLDNPDQADRMYHSLSNLLRIKLRAYKPYTYTGFTLRYIAVGDCGSELVAIEQPQSVSTPKYPHQYRSDLTCSWTITTRANHLIRLDTGHVSDDICCEQLQLRAPTIANLTSNTTYISPGASVTFDFISFKSSAREGFFLEYRAVHICGKQEFTAQIDVENTIHPPPYPGQHGTEMNCWYTIIAPDNTTIRFWIDDFGTERFGYNNFYLRFYNSLTVTKYPFLNLYQANQAGIMYHSAYNFVGIMLQAYRDYVYTGFRMRFMAADSCGSRLSAIEKPQSVSTPQYPQQYRSNLTCTWTITTQTNHLVRLDIGHVSNETCCEQLQLRAPTVANLTSNTTYISPGASVTFDFISFKSSAREGFFLQYRAVHICGKQEFTAQIDMENTIHPPPYPGQHGTEMNCWYTIIAPDNTTVRFWIDDFGTERFGYNNFYLRFYNSLTVTKYPFLNLYQANQAGIMHHSAYNFVGIMLQAYRDYVYTGFRMRFMAADSCGSRLSAIEKPQSVSTPQYPQQYRSNLTCTWTITTQTNHLVRLDIGHVSNETCCEQLQLRAPTVANLTSNTTYISPGASVTFDFISFKSSAREGFFLQYRAVHICGKQEFTAQIDVENTIHPPPYPGQYGTEMNCWYTIIAPDNTTIRFWIDDFGTERFGYNNFYLRFYNSLTVTKYPFLDLYQANQAGIMYHSAYNFVGIMLQAYRDYVYTGFRMRFMAIDLCGSELFAIEQSQSVSTPLYPHQYRSNLTCTWRIRTQTNHVIRLDTGHVSNDTCCEQLQLRSPTVMNLTSDQVYISPGTSLTIGFYSDKSEEREGFSLQFRAVHICGIREFTAEIDVEHTIHPPPYPGQYGTKMNCWYTIIAPENTTIRFWIDDFGTERFGYNNFYLRFYDSLTVAENPFLDLYQANQAGIMYHSLSNFVGIRLQAYRDYVYTGFRMRFMATDSCGSELFAIEQSQSVSTPQHPHQYRSNLTCTWRIRTQTNHVIRLDTGHVSNDTCCEQLQLRSPTVMNLTSDQVYISPGTSLTIGFYSDKSEEREGFSLQFRAVHICGIREFTAEIDVEHTIHPPPYPGQYGTKMICWYTIIAPENTTIRFWIDDFGTERFGYNNFYLRFYDSLTVAENPFLDLYQANQAGIMYQSVSNFVGIRLQAYRDYVYTGFRMRFMATDSCGSELFAIEQSQSVSTPLYPHQYRSNLTCTWRIRTQTNHVIRLDTGHVSNDTCCEQLQLRSPTVMNLTSDQVYISPGTSLTIGFYSDKSEEREGFSLQFRAVHICGIREFTAEIDVEHTIHPPPYPGQYGTKMICWYTIIAPENTTIRFWIDDFGTERFGYNNFYLRFYDSLTVAENPFLDLYQANQAGIMYQSVSNFVGIRLQAYRDYVYTGFRMRFLAADSCGSKLFAIEQPLSVSTPQYPHQYRSNLTCTWTISTHTNHVIRLDTGHASNDTCCEQLQVRSPAIQNLTSNLTYISSGPSASVQFISHKSRERSGFSLQYRAVHVCGSREFTAQIDVEDIIHPPPYTSGYGSSMTCWYTITAPNNTRIRFWIEDFGTERFHYSNVYMQFFDNLVEHGRSFLNLYQSIHADVMYHSISNVLGIKLRVARSSGYTGFTMRYMATDSCGTELVAIERPQSVSTPQYPYQYRSNLTCTWTITTETNYLVRLDTGHVSNNSCCEQLELLLPELRKPTTNQTYISPGKTVTVNFISNGSLERSGFVLHYQAVHVCGVREYTAEVDVEKVIHPPPFPNDYDTTIDCWYQIVSPKENRIRFWVNDLGTEQVSGSSFYLWFYDGYLQSSPNFLVVNDPSQIGVLHHSKRNVMSILRRVYQAYEYTGFRMTYVAINTCGSILDASSSFQTIAALGSDVDRICNWTIRAPCDHVIEVTSPSVFNQSESDRIFVIDDDSNVIPILTTTEYISNGRLLEMDLVANNSSGDNEFEVQYRAVHICGEKYFVATLDEESEISQDSYPESYGNYLICRYQVRSQEGTRIQFMFTDFGVDTYSQTYFEIEFYDGFDEQSENFLTLFGQNDQNTTRLSKSNIMMFKLTVNLGYVSYTGYTMRYTATTVENDVYVTVRVNYTSTYRIVVPSSFLKKYLLDLYNVFDIADEIFQQMRNDSNLYPELIDTNHPPIFNGSKLAVRVDFKWTFEIYFGNPAIFKYGFDLRGVNDITLNLFSNIRDEVEVFQLKNVVFEVPLVDSSHAVYVVRFGFHRTYNILLPRSIASVYGFSSQGGNDVSDALHASIRSQAVYMQLVDVEEIRLPDEHEVIVRVHLTRTYKIFVTDAALSKYKFYINKTNELSSSVFLMIQRDAELVQLIFVETNIKPPEDLISVRVAYKRTYKFKLANNLIQYYGFNTNWTNDVVESMFLEMTNASSYFQLISYEPIAPVPPIVAVRFNFTRSYHVSIPESTRRKYLLHFNQINDVTQAIFAAVHSKAYSLQLFNIESPGTIEGTLTIIRVDLSNVYHAYLSDDAILAYYLLTNETNELSAKLFADLTRVHAPPVQLVRVDSVSPSGTRVILRVDRHLSYVVYLPDDVILRYQFVSSRTNDVSTGIFNVVKAAAYITQLAAIDDLPPPSGIKINIRVRTSHFYDVYVTEQLKIKYRFFLKQTNDVSWALFDHLREEANFVRLIKIQDPEIFDDIPVRIRVGYKRVYNAYVSDEVKANFKLSVNSTTDISEEVFIRIQPFAKLVELIQLIDEDVTTQNKYRIRVDHDEVYDVYFRSNDVIDFPLIVGTMNDVTSSVFHDIRSHAFVVQLVSLHNNPVRVSVRVDYTWVYEVVVTDSIRRKYNLNLNLTSDVSSILFEKIRSESSYFQLKASNPKDFADSSFVVVRLNSTWFYNVSLSTSLVQVYNLTVNQINDVTIASFIDLTPDAEGFQLINVTVQDTATACPSNNWTSWFNRDDPSGPCDCETLTELRNENPGQICDFPISFEARLENCQVPYDPSLPNVIADLELGFECRNENGWICMDYEVRYCCP